MAGKVYLADERMPVEDFDALFYLDDLDLFSAQCSADGPAVPSQNLSKNLRLSPEEAVSFGDVQHSFA